MVDPTEPCVKCGVVGRFKSGECKGCNLNRKKRWARLNKPCGKCGVANRYENGVCKACSKKRKRHYPDPTTPCVKCGVVDRYKSGECKGCNRNRRLNYRKTNAYLESRKKQDDKAKRLKFEFSLQTQQKALTERQ